MQPVLRLRAHSLACVYLFCSAQRVNIDEAENLLPTASTCMNLLRLPRYSTKQRLKEKLIYAITAAQQGFGLT